MKNIILHLVVCAAVLTVGVSGVFGQQKGSTTKGALVKGIADSTAAVIPVAIHRKLYEKAKSDAPTFVKEQVKRSWPTVLSRQTNLSAAKKKTLTDNLPQIFGQLDAPLNRLVAARFTGVEPLLAAYLQENLSTYSTSEIIEIDRFLKSKAGISYLKQLGQIASNLTAQKAKPLEIEERYQSETGAFLSSEIGAKYNKMFLESNDAVFEGVKKTLTALLEDFNKDAEVGTIMNAFLKSV